jgi:hypothetical protein
MSAIRRTEWKNGSRAIQAMLRRLAEDERELLGKKAVGTVPVEAAKPRVKAALY